MAYDILEIEAKRQAAVEALMALYMAIPGYRPTDGPPTLKNLRYAAYLSTGNITPDHTWSTAYGEELEMARASQASLSHPSDSPEPSPWSSPEMRPKRFILKACGLWSDEYQEPMVTDPRTWSQINLAADLIGKYLTNPKYGSALTPDLFTKYFASTTDSPLRPQYIPERFNDFLSWCRTKGFIS